ncbi:MAG: hypothetical protein QM398_02280 [Thermoproteota archaeon]|nr:hypothetical protein [Thermoproteota archaeon]
MVWNKAIFIGAIVAVIMVSIDITLWLLATNGFLIIPYLSIRPP